MVVNTWSQIETEVECAFAGVVVGKEQHVLQRTKLRVMVTARHAILSWDVLVVGNIHVRDLH